MATESLADFKPPVGGEMLAEMARFYQKSLILAQAFEADIFAALADGPQELAELAMGRVCALGGDFGTCFSDSYLALKTSSSPRLGRILPPDTVIS